jgi:hypothetical protein
VDSGEMGDFLLYDCGNFASPFHWVYEDNLARQNADMMLRSKFYTNYQIQLPVFKPEKSL